MASQSKSPLRVAKTTYSFQKALKTYKNVFFFVFSLVCSICGTKEGFTMQNAPPTNSPSQHVSARSDEASVIHATVEKRTMKSKECSSEEKMVADKKRGAFW
jgi:hypothetical protein